jgi:ABC-type uncharacterized transport system permease subunit
MSLAQASWIVVVAVCVIATAGTLIAGYEGYAAVIAAVGLAASVNLLPRGASRSEAE